MSYILPLTLKMGDLSDEPASPGKLKASTVTAQNMDCSIPCWEDASGAAGQIDPIVS